MSCSWSCFQPFDANFISTGLAPAISAGLEAATSIFASPGGSKQAFILKLTDGITLDMEFSTRTNKSGFLHKLGQFENLAVKFNAVSGFTKN